MDFTVLGAALIQTIGLLFVGSGGACLYQAKGFRGQSAQVATALRLIGYVVITLGVGAVVITIYYPQGPYPELLHEYDLTVDGVLLLGRRMAFISVALGAVLVWGGRNLTRDKKASMTDVYFARVAFCLGYLFIICGFVFVSFVAAKLSFSADRTIPQLEDNVYNNYWLLL